MRSLKGSKEKLQVIINGIVDYDVIVKEYVHVNAGAICNAGCHIERQRKLEAGEVVMGYPTTVREARLVDIYDSKSN